MNHLGAPNLACFKLIQQIIFDDEFILSIQQIFLNVNDVPENLLGTMDIFQSLQGFPPSDSKQTNKR